MSTILTLQEIARYQKWLNGLKSGTAKHYEGVIASFLKWVEQNPGATLSEWTPTQAAAYLKRYGNPYTYNTHLTILRNFYKHLGFDPNPFKGLSPSPAASTKPVLTSQEVSDLFRACDPTELKGARDRTAFRLFFYALISFESLIAFRSCDFLEEENGTWLHLQGSTGPYTIPCHRRLSASIRSYRELAEINPDDTGPFIQGFRGRAYTLSGKAITLAALNSRLAALQDRLNLFPGYSLTTKVLSRTGMTLFFQAGVPLDFVSRMANHSSPATTLQYDPGQMQESKFTTETLPEIL